ncbi:MAG: hypothetical protein BGO55_13245 [Sphingobacteriales bacterium 50-39]|nr:hypothetical protein [Sphingobacteriales bacterium]OJW57266.1 MAG: hypothetical protein BGO55_13245 [Sphingobacteriales bacterium 50-39]
MEFLLFILVAVGVILFAAAYGISNVVYKKLERAGNSKASTIRVVTFVLSFLALAYVIVVFVFNNFRLER